MVLWYLSRNSKLPLVEIQGKHDRLVEFLRGPRLCQTLTTNRCGTSHVHARWSHARRTLPIPRTCCSEKPWEFWIGQVEVLIWMWSKTYSASSDDNQTMPTLSFVMWRIYALRFTGCEWHPSSINPPLNICTDVIALFAIYWVPEETSSDTDVSFFNLKRYLHLNAAVKLLGLKLYSSYPLSSKFRSLARNQYTSDYSEIYKSYVQRS